MTLDLLELKLAELFGQARRFVAAVRAVDIKPVGGAALHRFADALRTIGSGRMLSTEMEVALRAVHSELDAAVKPYYLRHEAQFDGYHDDIEGDVGKIVEVAIYDDAAMALELRVDADALIEGRAALIDLARAVFEIARILEEAA